MYFEMSENKVVDNLLIWNLTAIVAIAVVLHHVKDNSKNSIYKPYNDLQSFYPFYLTQHEVCILILLFVL